MNWLKLGTGLAFLSLAALWIALALALPFPAFARTAKVGPAHFPIVVASLLAILVIAWLIREHRAKEEREKEAKSWRLFLWYLGYGLYVALTPVLGFVPATFFFVSAVVGIKVKGGWARRLGKAMLTALLITGLEWAIFQKWLGVPLPVGVFGFFERYGR
ncbi:MAG: tripartite tricarboxylate transporter TctB family protein [Clostridia bacterium]|nr:tripartite tricarboxylate transporter TctB family protein [Clostridia bacterium]